MRALLVIIGIVTAIAVGAVPALYVVGPFIVAVKTIAGGPEK